MELSLNRTDAATIVSISGDIDAKSAPDIQSQVLPVVSADLPLVLDMSQVDYMSSAGLRMLLSIYRQSAATKARLVISGLSPELTDVMSATGFLEQFSLSDTVQSALESLGGEH
ncbi:MAG: anti-sigma factor antagonist [Thermoanaerobaculia bacterium]